MKSSLLPKLTLAFALLTGGSAFARDHFETSATEACWSHRHYTYAFATHPGWYPGRAYYWGGHHYRWYNNGWFIIDPYPVVAAGYAAPVYAPAAGGSVGSDVQAALARQGYYHGAIDGDIGPHSHAAIAAYQRDHGMYVTGAITPGLVHRLGIE